MRTIVLFVEIMVAVLVPFSAGAASRPASTVTPVATQTPYPTYTPPATQTPYPSPTVIPSPSPIPQGSDPQNPHKYCTGLLNWCPDLSGLGNAVGGLLNGAIVGLFSPLEHVFSDGYTQMVTPFQHDLTYTPDIPKEASWAALRTFQTNLQELAATLFFGFLLVGVFARYLECKFHPRLL